MRRFTAAPLSPRRLEKRRVLDASAAELLLGPLSDGGEYVQVGEGFEPPPGATGEGETQGPSNVELFLGESEIFENEQLQLAVMFENPNFEITHKILIDWGDGSETETYLLEPGVRYLGTSHQYLDDGPTTAAVDVNTIKVRVTDGNGDKATASAAVTVKNVAPTIETLLITSPIEEGEIATLTGTFTDPGTQDTYLLDIDWTGDGQFDETIEVSGGEFEASRLFPDDNPSNSLFDTFDVTARLRDDDMGSDTKSVLLTVADVSPFNVQIEPVEMIDENGFATIRVTFEDTGLEDTHFASINWGDGTPVERVDIEPGARSVTATHQYLDDDPTGTPSDSYTIRVGIINDDRGRSVPRPTTEVIVKNVNPVLDVAVDQEVDEGALLDLTGGGLGAFTDVGTRDTHTATVDWGDGSPVETVTVNQSEGFGSLSGSHIYADNGVYTVTVTVADDDLGETVQTFSVRVNNVDPMLEGIEPIPTVDEGESFTLADLGVTLKDPGFDNPLNPNFDGEEGEDIGSVETFTAATINWGDGTAIEALGVVNRVSGGPGMNTVAGLDSSAHTYADNGLYTVTITVGDDDGGFVERTFQIQVDNVAPTLVLTERELMISESETLDLFDLGEFSDPGFDNPLNVGGEVVETFSYTIDWGDGTVEMGQLPAEVLSGSVGVETLGKLVDSHQYLDNDADNLYTITVTLSDDDGGTVTRKITAKVLNVDPMLVPIISATDVNTRGETTIVIEFEDPGTETLTVWVDWGDKLELPPADRFVPETAVVGPGTNTLSLDHTYDGPPDPTSPASDILISVFVRDDDFGMPLVVDPGQSVTQAIAISNPGVGGDPVVIDTTPTVPRLIFPQQDDGVMFVGATSSDQGNVQTIDLRTAVGDIQSTTDRYLELRVIDPATGAESEGYRLRTEVLDDLPGLFRTLPDNRYRIYLVRTETNTRRLVIEVYVRNGKVIDPGDDSEGTRDRPPTDESTQGEVDAPVIEEPVLQAPQTSTDVDDSEALPAGSDDRDDQANASFPSDNVRRRIQLGGSLLGTSLLGLTASKSGRDWAERVEKALANASEQKWQKLRRRLHKRDNANNRKNA
ncbi:MAG: PKD domain-containing protein [Planctomycetota bacterium]